jgi:hypothetical protein
MLKKFVIIGLIFGVVYYFKPNIFPGSSRSMATTGSSENVVVFTHTGCGDYCDKALALLKEIINGVRVIDF